MWSLDFFRVSDDVSDSPAAGQATSGYAWIPVEKKLSQIKKLSGSQSIGLTTADPRYENHLIGLTDRHKTTDVDLTSALQTALGAADATLGAGLTALKG